jgi:hypothetical protein
MEMHTDTAVIPAVKRSPKARLLTAGHLDGRTRGSKRARSLAAELACGWDGITEVQRQAVERAGMLCALAEDLLARRLAGQPVSLDELLRAEGCAKRAVRAVIAERPVKRAALREFVELRRQRWAEAETRRAEKAKTAGEAIHTTEPPDGGAA